MKVGRWTRKFGGPKSFEYECGKAKEIDAEWIMDVGPLGRDRSGFVSVRVEEIPGWLDPLWSFWNGYLFLRRPEGVWKTKVPDSVWRDRPMRLLISGQCGSNTQPPLLLDMSIEDPKAWHWQIHHLRTPAEIDEGVSAESLNVNADFCGIYLSKVILDNEGEKLLVYAGDDFCSPPKFSLDGQYLIATDKDSNERFAFDLSDFYSLRQAIETKILWLRFEGSFLPAFDVQVEV